MNKYMKAIFKFSLELVSNWYPRCIFASFIDSTILYGWSHITHIWSRIRWEIFLERYFLISILIKLDGLCECREPNSGMGWLLLLLSLYFLVSERFWLQITDISTFSLNFYLVTQTWLNFNFEYLIEIRSFFLSGIIDEKRRDYY